MAPLTARRRLCMATIVVLLWPNPPRVSAEQPDHVINIWPTVPPGEEMNVGPEQDMTKDDDKLIAGRRIIKLGNVKIPQAHVYLPPANLRTGAAVVICPGGGFSILAWDLEGTEVAQWLNTLGVAGIVLKYRVPTRDQKPRWLAAAQDTQRTVGLTRHHSKEWNLDPDKIAVLGFSAGGMAAVKTALAKKRYYEPVDELDDSSCRPNRAVLIYAAGQPRDAKARLAPDEEITDQTPPMFIVHAFDDFVPAQGAAHMWLALKRMNVASELHIYDSGGHGYGLRHQREKPVTSWTKPCEAWLRRAKWID